MKSQSNKIIKYPIDAITICALLILFQSYILLFLGYVGNRIGLRDVPLSGVLVFWGVFVIAAASVLFGNYKANIRVDIRKMILPLVICFVNVLSVLYTSLINRNILDTVNFDIVQYVVYLPVVVAVFCSIEDYEKLKYWITIVARFAWIIPFLNIFLNYSRSGNNFEHYDMVVGYELIFCTMILLHSVFEKFNFLDLLLCTFTFFFALACGSRGSVLAFMIYLGISLFTKYFINQKQIDKVVFVVLSFGIIMVLLINFDAIVSGVKDVFNQFGINTRTLDSLLDGSIVEGSNESRKTMYKTIAGTWKSMPVTGHGILYDRLIVGSYCHNIVLEIITDHGFVLGTILMVWFAFNLGCSLLYADPDKKSFILILSVFTLTQLAVSSSYLTATYLFAIVGMIACNTQSAGKTPGLYRKEKHIS